jgi:biopolymer transport protein ExbB
MYDRVDNNDPEGAVALGKKSKDIIAKILTYALSHREQMNIAFVRAANNELKRYQQGGAVLDTVITAAPLLGLLGTVTGMMGTFGSLGSGGDIAASAGKITGGVAEALIATMCGLAIAITGLVPYNILNAKIEQTKHDISDASNALAILTDKPHKPEKASA